MWPWSVAEKWAVAKEALGGRFLPVRSAVLVAPAVLVVREDLPEKNRLEWSRPVSRRFRVLQVHTGDRSRVRVPG
jgi:hypothetical protein